MEHIFSQVMMKKMPGCAQRQRNLDGGRVHDLDERDAARLPLLLAAVRVRRLEKEHLQP